MLGKADQAVTLKILFIIISTGQTIAIICLVVASIMNSIHIRSLIRCIANQDKSIRLLVGIPPSEYDTHVGEKK